jgi:hypothetical protein
MPGPFRGELSATPGGGEDPKGRTTRRHMEVPTLQHRMPGVAALRPPSSIGADVEEGRGQ